MSDPQPRSATPWTWEARELPILVHVVEAFDRGETIRDAGRVAELAELELPDARRGLEALHDADYVKGVDATSMQGGFTLLDIKPTERARRATGHWPSEDAFDNLVALLERRIAATDDPEQRNHAQKVLDGLLGMGKAAGGALLGAYLREVFGLS